MDHFGKTSQAIPTIIHSTGCRGIYSPRKADQHNLICVPSASIRQDCQDNRKDKTYNDTSSSADHSVTNLSVPKPSAVNAIQSDKTIKLTSLLSSVSLSSSSTCTGGLDAGNGNQQSSEHTYPGVPSSVEHSVALHGSVGPLHEKNVISYGNTNSLTRTGGPTVGRIDSPRKNTAQRPQSLRTIPHPTLSAEQISTEHSFDNKKQDRGDGEKGQLIITTPTATQEANNKEEKVLVTAQSLNNDSQKRNRVNNTPTDKHTGKKVSPVKSVQIGSDPNSKDPSGVSAASSPQKPPVNEVKGKHPPSVIDFANALSDLSIAIQLYTNTKDSKTDLVPTKHSISRSQMDQSFDKGAQSESPCSSTVSSATEVGSKAMEMEYSDNDHNISQTERSSQKHEVLLAETKQLPSLVQQQPSLVQQPSLAQQSSLAQQPVLQGTMTSPSKSPLGTRPTVRDPRLSSKMYSTVFAESKSNAFPEVVTSPLPKPSRCTLKQGIQDQKVSQCLSRTRVVTIPLPRRLSPQQRRVEDSNAKPWLISKGICWSGMGRGNRHRSTSNNENTNSVSKVVNSGGKEDESMHRQSSSISRKTSSGSISTSESGGAPSTLEAPMRDLPGEKTHVRRLFPSLAVMDHDTAKQMEMGRNLVSIDLKRTELDSADPIIVPVTESPTNSKAQRAKCQKSRSLANPRRQPSFSEILKIASKNAGKGKQDGDSNLKHSRKRRHSDGQINRFKPTEGGSKTFSDVAPFFKTRRLEILSESKETSEMSDTFDSPIDLTTENTFPKETSTEISGKHKSTIDLTVEIIVPGKTRTEISGKINSMIDPSTKITVTGKTSVLEKLDNSSLAKVAINTEVDNEGQLTSTSKTDAKTLVPLPEGTTSTTANLPSNLLTSPTRKDHTSSTEGLKSDSDSASNTSINANDSPHIDKISNTISRVLQSPSKKPGSNTENQLQGHEENNLTTTKTKQDENKEQDPPLQKTDLSSELEEEKKKKQVTDGDTASTGDEVMTLQEMEEDADGSSQEEEEEEEDDSFLMDTPTALIQDTAALMETPMPVTPSKPSTSDIYFHGSPSMNLSPVVVLKPLPRKVDYTLDKLLDMKNDQEMKYGDISKIRSKLMEVVSRGGIAKLASETVTGYVKDVDTTEYPQCFAQYVAQSEKIPESPPGEEIFCHEKVNQLFTPSQCLLVQQWGVSKSPGICELLCEATTDELEEWMKNGFLDCYYNRRPIPSEIMRWMFMLMSIHPSSLESHILYNTLWGQLNKAPLILDELEFPWKPTLKDIITVLLNYGGDLASLVSVSDYEVDFTKETLRHETNDSVETRDSYWKDGEVFSVLLESHIGLVVKIITQAIITYINLKDCSGYRTEELQCLLIVLFRVSLDKNILGLPVTVDISNAISTILEGFEDSVWDQQVERLCVLFPLITSHHHNMVYLLQSCIPLHIERGRYLYRMLGYAGLQTLVFPEKGLRLMTDSEEVDMKVSSLIPILHCCKPSRDTDYYQLHSIILLLDFSIGNEVLKTSERMNLEQIIRKLREMVGEIRDNAHSMCKSQVKSLIVRTATKLSFMTQAMVTKQASIFSFLRSTESMDEGYGAEHHISSQTDADSLPSEDEGADDIEPEMAEDEPLTEDRGSSETVTDEATTRNAEEAGLQTKREFAQSKDMLSVKKIKTGDNIQSGTTVDEPSKPEERNAGSVPRGGINQLKESEYRESSSTMMKSRVQLNQDGLDEIVSPTMMDAKEAEGRCKGGILQSMDTHLPQIKTERDELSIIKREPSDNLKSELRSNITQVECDIIDLTECIYSDGDDVVLLE